MSQRRKNFRFHAPADQFALQSLEPRLLLSGFSWTAEEVYLLELVNRARANPAAEQARLNAMPGDPIDLTEGLSQTELLRLVASEPLALNSALTMAARAHSLDMAQRDFFDHNNPDGQSPTDRAVAAGYAGSAGENIAAGYSTVDAAHRAWIQSVGHRKNVFSLHAHFDPSFHYDEFGPGFAFTNIAPYFDFYTQLFGVPNGGAKYVLGVIYNDANGNQFYNIGEGMANVRVDVAPQGDPFNIVGTYTTDAAGNYQIPVTAGAYTVTFTDLGNGRSYTQTITVGAQNVKVDARSAQITANTDDHANAGDLVGATVIMINGADGNGAAAGVINHPSDTDLFRFTAAGNGQAVVRLTRPTGNLTPVLTVLGPGGDPLGVGETTETAGERIFVFNVVQGAVYYVLVAPEGGASAGPYALSVDGPVADAPPPAESFIAAPGATLTGAGSTAGELTISAINENGRPIVFQQRADGSWSRLDLSARVGGPTITGEPMTWTDPKDGRAYVAATSGAGLMLYTNSGVGEWTARNLTAEIDGAPLITGESTAFTDAFGVVRVAGLGDGSELIVYGQTGAGQAGAYAWNAVNVTQRDYVPQGLATPAFAGKLISFVTPWNALNVAGLDADGNIVAAWWAPSLTAWSTDNLSAKTGAPPIAGGLTAWTTEWNAINLAGVNAQGEMTVTWWLPSFGADWATDNLTSQIDGPLVQPATVASYVTPWGGMNVVAADTDGRLVAYWWAPGMLEAFGSDAWRTVALSEEVEGGPRPAGALTGVSYGDTISILGAAEESNHVFRYWWQVGGAWMAEDVTAIATPA